VFVRFQNIVFTSLVTDERMNGRMNEQVKNMVPPPASLAQWSHNKYLRKIYHYGSMLTTLVVTTTLYIYSNVILLRALN